jgi:hypothetical protein
MRALSVTGVLVWVGLLAGCNGKDSNGVDGGDCAEATVPEANPTVVVLEFDTDQEAASYVEFSVDGGETRTTPTDEPSTHHKQVLLGLPPETDVAYTIKVDGDTTCEGTIQTERLPATFPPFEVTIDQPDKYVEPYLMITFIKDPKVLAVIDRQGNVLWYLYADEKVDWATKMFPKFHPGLEDDLAIIHATLWQEQKQLVYNLQAQAGDVGSILWTNWLKEDLRGEVAPLSHHTFALNHQTGTVTYITLDVRDWFDPEEGKKVPVVGDAFVDLDSEGQTTELLNTWDQFEVKKNSHWDVAFYPQGHDWTHANATNYFADKNSFLFSFANTNTFMEWSYDTGPGHVYTWSDWHAAKGTTPFTYQHDPRWTPDGNISMTATPNDGITRGLVYNMDYATNTYTQVWSHGDGPGYDPVYAFALGENHELANGNRLVSFGSAAVLREVTPDDEVVWELHASPKDIWIGSVEAFTDFYTYE